MKKWLRHAASNILPWKASPFFFSPASSAKILTIAKSTAKHRTSELRIGIIHLGRSHLRHIFD
ncbi:hypothetical protein [Nostoc sp.]|uniref:hypothetical protein n=1 Tax=Nostoc sp. TaxID=1180 RepID=UPI002FF51820